MPDDPEIIPPDDSGQPRRVPHSEPPAAKGGTRPPPPDTKTIVRGSDVTSIVVFIVVLLLVVPVGVLQILAATTAWNPLALSGRLWTGIFLVLAPASLVVTAALPYRIRRRIPESLGCLLPLLFWTALFVAYCNGK